jgi:hypothetical protein
MINMTVAKADAAITANTKGHPHRRDTFDNFIWKQDTAHASS